MVPGVLATFETSALSPVLAGLTTLIAAFGHTVLPKPSASSPHVAVVADSVSNDVLLIRSRYFLRMCVEPAESRRTTRVIVSLLQLDGVSVSPLSVISPHVVIVPREIFCSVALPSA